ncbi:hypothetical protein BHE74_00024330 [Ensete ventricosum]|nr:hypothetical protein BHE74_00024330 [Ensete ventricosum]RZR82247.1 hypothetical protein BHM03_00008618 [Ensete ventricosum]
MLSINLICCSYFIKLFFGKEYALPYRVLDVEVAHFMRFLEETRIMSFIWHQSVLAFVQRLIFNLSLPEILRELKNSWNHGEEDDPMAYIYPW